VRFLLIVPGGIIRFFQLEFLFFVQDVLIS